MIRAANPADLEQLLEIEHASFDGDRLSRRSMRHLLTKGNALALVDEHAGLLRGYIMLLFHADHAIARIYSIAVAREWHGQLVGKGLVAAAERAAASRQCVRMRLEVRKDNMASRRLFKSAGYRMFGRHPRYYQDGMDAVRMERALLSRPEPSLSNIAYYRQTLGFTCGACCLMMAMNAFDPSLVLDRTLELQLWREATTIFMTAGHGGCGPYGLALAAARRGFVSEVYVNGRRVPFRDSVRSEEKRDVIQLVHDDFVRQVHGTPIRVHHKLDGPSELMRCLAAGGVALVLISMYRLTGERAPHWVLVTSCDEHCFYFHDPDNAERRGPGELANLAILKTDFERMARYGRHATRALVAVYPRAHRLPHMRSPRT
jgi:ribosomal protein S18 acetylase RimI-like enzyme